MRDGMRRREILFIKNWRWCMENPTIAQITQTLVTTNKLKTRMPLLTSYSTFQSIIHTPRNIILEYRPAKKRKSRPRKNKRWGKASKIFQTWTMSFQSCLARSTIYQWFLLWLMTMIRIDISSKQMSRNLRGFIEWV